MEYTIVQIVTLLTENRMIDYRDIDGNDVTLLKLCRDELEAELKVWRPDTTYEGKACPACGRKYDHASGK